MAFALAGLVLAVPAALLPFITVEKLGNVRTGNFVDGVFQLHAHGMPFLAVWVFICGSLAPILLLIALLANRRHVRKARSLGEALAHWTMPEVYVLAVFVSLMRLGKVVDVEINAGFWSYTAMSIALLLSWRSFRLQPPVPSAS
jgi:paraquat-inducible protein A